MTFVLLYEQSWPPKETNLNTELFIARRIISGNKNRKHFSSTITGVVIFGISLSIAVMIASVAIVTGFKKEIRNKVIGFGSDIQVINYDSNLSYQTSPIPLNDTIVSMFSSIEGVRHVQPFAIKAGIVKTSSDIQGLVLKGIGEHFDWSFFDKSMKEGQHFNVTDSAYSNSIVISSWVARKLKMKVGDSFHMWFVDKRPRFRKFTISGIYETSLSEFDQTFAIVDIKHIQRLNDWTNNQVSGLELEVDNFNDLTDITWEARASAASFFFDDGSRLKVRNIVERYPQIFDWLKLQDINVIIIIVLMLVVAGFNMISGLLILILDRTYMIGVLKALGSPNLIIRKIFLYQSSYLILRGLLWGNLIGIALCFLQKKYELIRLNPENYYLTTVPINLNILHILLINAGAMLVIMMFLIIPSMLVSRISPARSIRFT
ncbi:MAG TPA: ABC transporter permease [Bacteroidales bacterium]|nr:ABC transporter permease [Bacteroidales bacterium]